MVARNFARTRGGGATQRYSIFTRYAIPVGKHRPTVARFRAPTFGLASLTLFGKPLRECRSRFTTSRPPRSRWGCRAGEVGSVLLLGAAAVAGEGAPRAGEGEEGEPFTAVFSVRSAAMPLIHEVPRRLRNHATRHHRPPCCPCIPGFLLSITVGVSDLSARHTRSSIPPLLLERRKKFVHSYRKRVSAGVLFACETDSTSSGTSSDTLLAFFPPPPPPTIPSRGD